MDKVCEIEVYRSCVIINDFKIVRVSYCVYFCKLEGEIFGI